MGRGTSHNFGAHAEYICLPEEASRADLTPLSIKLARIIGHLSDACQILLLFSDMKTNTKSKAKKAMKRLHTQMSFDF